MREFTSLEPLQLTKEQSIKAFRYRLDKSTVIPAHEFQVPSYPSVQTAIRLEELLSPWKDDSLDGFRLAEFRNFPLRGKIKELTRSSGRITWSADVQGDALQQVVAGFSNCLGHAASHFVSAGFHACFEAGQKIAFQYSQDLFTRLLKESLTLKERPRLVPQVKLAPWSEMLADLKKIIPRFPWVYEDFGGRVKLHETEGRFVLDVFGERGERELHEELGSADEAIFRLVDEMLRNSEFNNQRITFDPVSLKHFLN